MLCNVIILGIWFPPDEWQLFSNLGWFFRRSNNGHTNRWQLDSWKGPKWPTTEQLLWTSWHTQPLRGQLRAGRDAHIQIKLKKEENHTLCSINLFWQKNLLLCICSYSNKNKVWWSGGKNHSITAAKWGSRSHWSLKGPLQVHEPKHEMLL